MAGPAAFRAAIDPDAFRCHSILARRDYAAFVGTSFNLSPSTRMALFTVSMVGLPPGRNAL